MEFLLFCSTWYLTCFLGSVVRYWVEHSKRNSVYYINTSEILSELSHKNFISSHVKITCYLHTWRDHRCYGYIINRAFESKLTWYFTGVYIIYRKLHTRLWIWILSSRVQRDISLVRYRVDHYSYNILNLAIAAFFEDVVLNFFPFILHSLSKKSFDTSIHVL